MKNSGTVKNILILGTLSYLLFMWGNGILSCTNVDEVFYAQTAKEMVHHGSWLTPYLFDRPQFEKPIVIYWLLRIAYMLFGVSGFSARFFSAVFASIGVIATYLFGTLLFKNEKKAFICAIILGTSVLYLGLGRALLTDMVFSVLILLSLLSFFWGYAVRERRRAGLLLFFIFSALAVLAKGPLGFMLPVLTALSFLLIRNEVSFLFCRASALGMVIFALISAPWYLFMIGRYGHDFIREFFYNNHIRRLFEAEHKTLDHWYFYPLTMIGGLFPWSVALIASIFYFLKKLLTKNDLPALFIACWVCVVFAVFQIPHSKLMSYILPLFPALALMTGGYIYDVLLNNGHRSKGFIFMSITHLMILIGASAAIGVGLYRYSDYITSKAGCYFLSVAILIMAAMVALFIVRNRVSKTVYAMSLTIPILLSIVPFVRDDIEPYVSSREACEYLVNNYRVDNAILCSKIFVRGVRFYTDKDVAVMSIPGRPFFHQHPIEFVDTDVKLKDFFLRQRITYCIVKKSSLEDIDRVASAGGLGIPSNIASSVVGKEIKYSVLKIIGNEYILKVERSSR